MRSRIFQGSLCVIPESNPPLPEVTICRAVNRARAEKVKRRKDALVAKKAVRARQRLELEQRRRRQQATNEKEE